MAYSLVAYTSAKPRVFEDEASAITAVFSQWPHAAISILVDEIERRDHVVVWATKDSRERFDSPVAWVSRAERGERFNADHWKRGG